jgi:hypothetical protein
MYVGHKVRGMKKILRDRVLYSVCFCSLSGFDWNFRAALYSGVLLTCLPFPEPSAESLAPNAASHC